MTTGSNVAAYITISADDDSADTGPIVLAHLPRFPGEPDELAGKRRKRLRLWHRMVKGMGLCSVQTNPEGT